MRDAITANADLSEDAQKHAGKAIGGTMDDKQKDFLLTVVKLINDGTINPSDSNTFINADVYASLEPEWKKKTDLALVNIADQLRVIKEFYDSKETPNESPHLQTMIEQLWLMKERIESHTNVFVF